MEITATNLGKKRAVKWRLKTVYTGIFKSPINTPLFLDKEDVKNDHVIDRKYHGGIDKACYLFSEEAYAYWQDKYSNQTLTPGWFGENLTVRGLSEAELHIGNQYQIGEAIIEISQPREPCFKLGIRFDTQKVIKQFINHHQPGTYVRVIQPGHVKTGDRFELIHHRPEEPTILEVYQLIYGLTKNQSTIQKTLQSKYLAASAMKTIVKKYA